MTTATALVADTVRALSGQPREGLGEERDSRWRGRRIVRVGQWILVASSILLLSAVDPELSSWPFAIGMFCAGAALGWPNGCSSARSRSA